MLKKIAILLSLLGLAFALLMLTTGESQFQVHSSISLPASPAQVWRVLAAVEKWPEWWPGAKNARLDGPLVAGSKIGLQLRGVPSKDPALLTLVAAPHRLVWERPGVLGSRAGTGFLLEAYDSGSRLTVENFVRGPQAFLARITGQEAFVRYQRKLLENFARQQQKWISDGEKD